MTSYLAPRAARRVVPSLRCSSRFRAVYARGIDALTGQTGTLVRASSSTALDANGATATIGYGMPRYEARAWYDAVDVGLRMSGDDLSYGLDWLPEAGTLYVSGYNLSGAAPASNAGLVYLGRDDATGARCVVRGSGSTYEVDWITGGGTSTATLAIAVPAGARFELVAQVDDDGADQKVRVRGCVNGVFADWSAWGTPQARATVWGTGAKFRLNRVGSAGTQGDVWIREVAWEPGALDLHEMEARY